MKNETRYHHLLLNLDVGIVVHAPDTSIIMSNSKASELLGLDNQNMIGKKDASPDWKFFNENRIKLLISEYPINQILKTKKTIKNQVIGILKSKKEDITWVRVNGFPILDGDENIIEVVISFLDITDQKNATIELSQQKVWFESIFNCIPDAIVYTNINREIIGINTAFSSILGYTINDLLGKKTSAFYESIEEYERQGRIRFNLTTKELSLPYEVNYRKKDGSIFAGETLGTTVKNADGIVMGYVGVIRDITERKKADIEKFKLLSQLQQSQKMDAIGQLAGGVAHDFNNMLTGIINAAQLLKSSEQSLGKTGLEFVEMILNTSKRATELTSKLLAFGRKDKVSSTFIDVHKVIDDTLVLFNRTIDKKIKILVVKNAKFSTVLGDSSALENSLLNLGINASYAMKNGGELLIETKNLSLSKDYCKLSPFDIKSGEYIEIKIQDTGVGISPKNIKKIFEPFFTTKEEGEGTGLGLASVYGTVQSHHGAVDVYSEEGRGTIFHIYLPCSKKTIKSSAILAEEYLLNASGQILLVDDEEVIRLTSKYMLEKMGFKVLIAENGEEALDIFREKFFEIDLVITDMIMPKMSGAETFYNMKEVDANCKVIISSGFIKNENLDKLKKAGLAGFIQKPFMNHELSKLLSEVLRKE